MRPSKRRWRRALICASALLLTAVPAARADSTDPLLVFGSAEVGQGELEGPCGLSLDSTGAVYVGDYYRHAVEAFSFFPVKAFKMRLPAVGADGADGPCALALDSGGRLFVNYFHQGVVRFLPGAKGFGEETTVDPGRCTGIAIDPTSQRLYVDHRTYVAVYEPDGEPVLDEEGHPLRIGEGVLQNAYGVAVGGGRLYVADADSETVEIFEPSAGAGPVGTVAGPPGGFTSLRDTALALDRSSGTLYVADELDYPAEAPEAAIEAFSPGGSYLGQLKHHVVDAEPPGLTVDGTGRVYVTSGNTEKASIYVYGPGAQTSQGLPATGGLQAAARPAVAAAEGALPVTRAGVPAPLAQASRRASSVVEQRGSLRVSVEGSLSPHRLPRSRPVPISVAVGWSIATTDGSPPPELGKLSIEINRHGRIDTTGLPLCPLAKIQPASSARALANCRSALVGQGGFSALVGFGEQEAYETHGRLLVFNGQSHGKPVLFGQIYSPHPFSSSFVIPFGVSSLRHGTYGTLLSARLPAALRSWGNLTAIRMTLSRRYGYRGTRHSYLSGSCPAPEGFGGAVFQLARTTFAFAGEGSLTSTLSDQCKVR